MSGVLTGTRIRERRTVLGIRQADLARRVEISPSYLNLIEHNRRRIGGKLLVGIARALSVDVSALTQGAEAEVLDQLNEAALANPAVHAEIDRINELVSRFPGWAALAAVQSRRISALEEKVAELGDRMAHDPYLAAALHEVLSKVASIRSTSAILTDTADLDDAWRTRFNRNLRADSLALSESAESLVTYLEAENEIDLGNATPQEELEAFLVHHDYHLPDLERAGANPQSLLEQSDFIRSDAGRARAMDHFRQYLVDARALPITDFLKTVEEEGIDPMRIAGRFKVDIPTVFRRLATLPKQTDVPAIGLVICDGAGALIFRKPVGGFPLPRFGAACPLWPLFQALSKPMTPVHATLHHVSAPERRHVALAFCQPLMPVSFTAEPVMRAMMLLHAPDAKGGSVPAATETVGSSCRICPRTVCAARREGSILADIF